MLIKRNKKKNMFCMSSKKFFMKYFLQDNYWVGNSVTKPADVMKFQNRK